jgi:hypothetical protein
VSNDLNPTSSSISAAETQVILDDLNSLVVNCSELREVERLLGNFNLFRVLRFEHGEIRHSNVLAWLLQPTESHGLKDLFLRRWLMRIFHESESEVASHIDPVELDSLSIRSVDVYREWNEKSAYIIVEIVLWGRIPVLKILAGHSPEKWSDELWEMSFKEPFKGQKRKKKPTKYMAVYVVKDKHPLEDLEAQSVDDLADEIWKWCKAELISEDFKKCLTIIKDHIQKLPQKT